MRFITIATILALALGCGGGGGPALVPAELTAQELLETCLVGDLQDLSGVLEVVQGFVDTGGDTPLPQIDLLSLLTGNINWFYDLDGDQVNDLSGTVFLKDSAGAVMSAGAFGGLIGDLLGGETPDIAAFFAGLPDGTSVNLTFDFAGLQQAGPGGSGDFAVTFSGGEISDVGGSGSFGSDECVLDVDFNDIPLDGLNSEEGFGSADVGFGLGTGANALGGSVTLDGTNIAVVTIEETGQTLYVDLEAGTISETPPN